MGCGPSNNAVESQDAGNGHSKTANRNGAANGHNGAANGQNGAANGHNGAANGHNGAANGHNGGHDDDLPTVVLPETPIKTKPPIAFEIPLEEFEGVKRINSPPPHLQRLLKPPQPEISLPDIEEKLAEAELRRQTILQQRAASAQKRTQKMLKTVHEMERLNSTHDYPENLKHGTNTLTIPPEPGVCEDKNIS